MSAIGTDRSGKKYQERFIDLRPLGVLMEHERGKHPGKRHTGTDQQRPAPRFPGTDRPQEHGWSKDEKRGEEQVADFNFREACQGAEKNG